MQRSEEELRAGTREREAGQIRVNKQVRTDREQVRVPTRHEEVSVERVPVEEEDTGAGIGEDEVSIPVVEDEVVVEKRPVERRCKQNRLVASWASLPCPFSATFDTLSSASSLV